MSSFENKLDKYAELSVKVGINIQPGQTLVINAPIEAAPFVRKIAVKAYKAGAKNVHVEWGDELLRLIKFQHAPEESLKEFPLWKAKGYEEMAENGGAFLSISASNPDLLKDIDPQKIATYSKAAMKAMDGYREYVHKGKVSWSILSIPTKEWAKKVFPNMTEEESIEKLWESIFKVTRVDCDNPVEAWDKHINNLKKSLTYLNEKKFKKLYYKSSGTDLTIELPEDHIWIGGGLNTEKDIYFIPNMPTEEVFTLPKKNGVNGYVTSTKPLNYGGTLIDNFKLTFKDGKIVDFSAEKGYETLKKLIETDEGSHYLGEVALVPFDSPISNSNILFYNTLYDENASSHLALGSAYPLTIKNGAKLSKEDLEKKGANTSLTHVDFMIGSSDLNIDGETVDGEMYPIFKDGNWAFN